MAIGNIPEGRTHRHRIAVAVKTQSGLWKAGGNHPISPKIAEAGGVENYIGQVAQTVATAGNQGERGAQLWVADTRKLIQSLTA